MEIVGAFASYVGQTIREIQLNSLIIMPPSLLANQSLLHHGLVDTH